MKDPLPPPASSLELLLTKHHGSLTGISSALRRIEQKLETVATSVNSAVAASQLVGKDLTHLIEIEQTEHRAIEDIRRALEEQRLRVHEAAKDIEEIRDDLTPSAGIQLSNPEDIDTDKRIKEDPPVRQVINSLVVIGRFAKKRWHLVSLAGGSGIAYVAWAKIKAFLHIIAGWLHG